MVKADELIEKIRIKQKPLAERILHHRYLEAVETSGMAPEQFRIFAGQQCHIITSDLRSIALLLSRHGNLSSRPYLFGLLQGENAALEELSKFGHALETGDAEIRWRSVAGQSRVCTYPAPTSCAAERALRRGQKIARDWEGVRS